MANDRLSLLGMKPLYLDVTENPYSHLERLQDTNAEK